MSHRSLTSTVTLASVLLALTGCASTPDSPPVPPTPVRTALTTVPDDSQLAAEKALQRAQARADAQAARAAALATSPAPTPAASPAAPPKTAPVTQATPTKPPAAPAPAASVRDVGEATLRSLPGNAGVHLSWNDPGLDGHLGGVFEGDTTTILINETRLAGNASKTKDVVRHEMGHIYAGRLMSTTGMSWAQLAAAQTPAFGSNAAEKVADCVARHFGATWTNYTSDCASADKQAWVTALIEGHLP